MTYAYDAGLIERIMPRLRQYESTTGRRITPQMLDALIKGQLEAEAGKATRERALDLQERGMADQRAAQDKANKAAKVSGITGAVGTAANIGLTYKYLSKPSAMEEMTLYNNSVKNNAANQKLWDTGWPNTNTTTTSTGAQTTLAGGTTPVGAQVQPAAYTTTAPAYDAASMSAYDAAMAEGAAEGVGSTAGTSATAGYSATGSTAGNIGVGVAAGLATQYAVTKTGEGKASNARVADFSRDWLGMTNWNDAEYASKGSATVGGLAGNGPWGAAVSNIVWDIGQAFKTGKVSNELIGIPFADKLFNTNVKSIFGW